MKTVAFDCETLPIGPGDIAPRMICASFFDTESGGMVVGNDQPEELKEVLRDVLDNYIIVTHNGSSFDLGVVANTFPELIPNIFQALEDRRVHDTLIREKLHNLGQHGKLDFIPLPDGSQTKASYALSSLEKKYLGRDRTEEKVEEDAWRTNYAVLDGMPVEQYPERAYKYALDDAEYTYRIYQLQEKDCSNLDTEWLHVQTNFCLFLMTMVGWKVDHDEVKKVEAMLAEELTEDKLNLIIEAGILRPGQPERPKLRGTGTVAAKPPSVNRKALQAHVLALSKAHGIPPKLTDKGLREDADPDDPEPQYISTDSEVIQELALLDPIMEQYRHRQELQKLVTTYVPAFYWEGEPVERIHATYDVLKETGRTSSHSNRLYPSRNDQQVDPRVRRCTKADDGFVLISSDYSSLELVSLAWTTHRLFGKSRMWDLLHEGVDLHAYLAATQLAPSLSPDFREATTGLSLMEKYELFKKLEEVKPDFYDHWRTFAKPTGLGYPGGLGPETMLSYAKATYKLNIRELATELGVKQGTFPDINIDTQDPGILLAAHLRNLWFEAFPEMRDYFEYINNLPAILDTRDGSQRYIYETPLGMRRSWASFCAAANGLGLQSPSAEGAKLAIWKVARACWLPGGSLYGCIPLAFIHDQIIIEAPDNEDRDRAAHELCRIMVEAMKEVLQGAPVTAEPVLMYHWDKKAKTVYDDNGKLIVWDEYSKAA